MKTPSLKRGRMNSGFAGPMRIAPPSLGYRIATPTFRLRSRLARRSTRRTEFFSDASRCCSLLLGCDEAPRRAEEVPELVVPNLGQSHEYNGIIRVVICQVVRFRRIRQHPRTLIEIYSDDK